MAFQFVVLAALVAVANAGAIGAPLSYAAPAQLAYASAPVAYAQPIAKAIVAKSIDADFDPHPQYSYAYDVQDSITGDFKNQHETRDGDLVRGSYSLLEADGSKRTVDYTADSINGFNAVVHKEPAGVALKAVAHAPIVAAPQPAIQYAQPAVALKAVAHAPAVQYAQPIAAAPAKIAYAQPQLSYAQAAQYSYAQPAKYSFTQPAQYSFAQPIASAHALSHAHEQVTYAQPVAKYAPALSYGTPIAKFSGPISYHVTYSTPYFSYSH
ncbi:cuticle protein 21-like isoform X1 [Belonocnema kinseyi]|uniref:cuticle protein 21-like isoform X1 n=1 Tax=Belonocnema kinseyi TaxID=2817044 RepID=UPI00143E0B02|nr:cuticle protein 21-like isoform X1 [Belonocnema kinseyi]